MRFQTLEETLKKENTLSLRGFTSSIYLQNHFTYCVKHEKEANVFIFSFSQNVTAYKLERNTITYKTHSRIKIKPRFHYRTFSAVWERPYYTLPLFQA